jgi:hypothetical protein
LEPRPTRSPPGSGIVATAGAGQPIPLRAATLLRDDLGTIFGAARLTTLGFAIGSLIRSHVAGIVAVLVWALVIEPVIGGLFTSAQLYLHYDAVTTLTGAGLESEGVGVHFEVQHGVGPTATATPLPFGAVVTLLGALAIVLFVLATRSRLRAGIT